MLMVPASNLATILNASLKRSKSGSKRHSIGEIATPRVSVAAGSRCRSFGGSMKVRSQVGVLSLEFPECVEGRRVGDRFRIGVVATGDVRAVEFWLRAAITPVGCGDFARKRRSRQRRRRSVAGARRRPPLRGPQPKREAAARSSRTRVAQSRVTSPAARWRAPRPTRRSCRRRNPYR